MHRLKSISHVDMPEPRHIDSINHYYANPTHPHPPWRARMCSRSVNYWFNVFSTLNDHTCLLTSLSASTEMALKLIYQIVIFIVLSNIFDFYLAVPNILPDISQIYCENGLWHVIIIMLQYPSISFFLSPC